MRNLCLGIILSLLAVVCPKAQEHGSLRVLLHGPAGLAERLLSEGFDSWPADRSNSTGEWVETMIHKSELPRLRGLTAGKLLLITERSRPFREIMEQRQRALGLDMPDAGYHTLAEINQDLADLETAFPNLAKVYDFQSRYGTPLTHEGQTIPLLRISDNPDIDENEPNILLFTNHHCRELNTIEVSFFVADKLLQGYGTDAELTALVNQNQIWIVPTMNPDGLNQVWNVDNFWRKNRRNNLDGTFGVDLNRNYPFFWSRCGSSDVTSSQIYHGPSAASEPESQAMLAFVQAEGLERMLDVHSFGRDVRTPFNSLIRPRLPTAISGFYDFLHPLLANTMGYVPNTSCCCGTHMEWHQNVNGTMSFLIEMGTGFQPPFAETLTELDRLWPGIALQMTTPAPMRGRVVSLRGLNPLEASITMSGETFRDGQTIRSLGRHGRYALWAAPGNYDVTFAAPGHRPLTIPATLIHGSTFHRDVNLDPIAATPSLSTAGPPRIGNTVELILDSPEDAGMPYFVLVSTAPTPAIPFFDREIPLALTPLFSNQTSLTRVFVDTAGILDAGGQGRARFVIPNQPGLVGLELWFCGLTFDPAYLLTVKGISPNLSLLITDR